MLFPLLVFFGMASAPLRLIAFLANEQDMKINEGCGTVAFNLITDLGCIFLLPLGYMLFYNTNGYPGKVMFANGGVVFWSIWIIICVGAYFVGSYTRDIQPLAWEFVLNLLLGAGIAVNFFIGFDLIRTGYGFFMFIIGNGPIILLFLIALEKRKLIFHRLLPGGVGAPRCVEADLLDSTPTPIGMATDFSELTSTQAYAARILSKSFYSRLGVFMVGGFMAVSAGLLLAKLFGYDWY